MKRCTVRVVRDDGADEYQFFAKKPRVVEKLVQPDYCSDPQCCPPEPKMFFVGGGRKIGETCFSGADSALPFLKRLPANTPVRVVIG